MATNSKKNESKWTVEIEHDNTNDAEEKLLRIFEFLLQEHAQEKA